MYINYEFTSELYFLGFPKYHVSLDGYVYSDFSDQYITQKIDDYGYLRAQLHGIDGKCYNLLVHRLVALAFVPTTDVNLQINHKDGNKTNNWYSNLEWATNLQNAHHALRSGLMPHAVLNDQKCHQICHMLACGISQTEISNQLNIPYTTISSVFRRKNWIHISNQYIFPSVQSRTEPMSGEVLKIAYGMIDSGISIKDTANHLDISYVALKKRNSNR